jgi:hypothetical protein
MMTKLKRKVRKVEIELPKGKIIILIPICEPVDTSDIKRIEKQQRSVDLGTCNGIPSTISMTSISGELVQSYSTTEEFLVYFDLISRRVILKAKNLLARTINKDGELVDSKIVSKTICPLNSYFLCRFNVLSLNPNNPNNGPMHINQLWISDPVITSNTKNIDDIMVLGNMGISIVSPEKGFVLFTEVFQAGMKLRKNVSTLMITTTERITDYIFNAIDVPLS